jgi:4-aminobutyrate aminotransferase
LTNHIANVAQERGLLMRTSLYGYGNAITIRPALIMTHAEADEMLDVFEQLLLDVAEGRT